MASSSFHYALRRKDDSRYPHKLVAEILQIRLDNPDFGYRTVTAELKNRGKRINHKVVLKIMKQNNVLCHAFDRKTRKYNSYRGTVGKLAKNKLKRSEGGEANCPTRRSFLPHSVLKLTPLGERIDQEFQKWHR